MKDTLKINSQQNHEVRALHQPSWQIIAKRFDLNDIQTTRSLLAKAHLIILEQDRLIDSQKIIIEKIDLLITKK